MKCFTWETRTCTGEGEKCRLNPDEVRDIEATKLTAVLKSPRYEQVSRKSWGRRFFCLYNVSLSCPGNAVTIQKIDTIDHKLTWSRDAKDRSNYVNFYTNQRSEGLPAYQYYDSEAIFDHRLESSSFLAVMWNSDPKYKNRGKFEFHARCVESDPTQPPATESSHPMQLPTRGSDATQPSATGSDPTQAGSGDALLNTHDNN